MKTIVINALSALRGGGQTYLINLFGQFEKKYSEKFTNVAVIVIVPNRYKDLFSNSAITTLAPEFPSKSIIHRFLWERFRLPRLIRELRADALYCPGDTVTVGRLKGCKIAVAFRNMLPFDPFERKRHPFGYMRIRLWLLRFLQSLSFKNADLVIFISEYAKKIIDLTVRHRNGKSIVIPHGVPAQFYRDDSRCDSPLPYEYVLYVSYLGVYKNQLEVIKAWQYLREARRTREKLVMIGPVDVSYLHKVKKAISDYGLHDEVVYLGEVEYDELPEYYQFAKINIFASSCENCPNILLEALASGQPLFCSNRMPMPEFGGDATVYFDPTKPEELANLIIRHIDDADFLRKMGKAAYERSLLFDLEVNARRTWDALVELID